MVNSASLMRSPSRACLRPRLRLRVSCAFAYPRHIRVYAVRVCGRPRVCDPPPGRPCPRPPQLFSMLLAPFQALNFTGMGGPMGVYEPGDTDRCDTGGMHCVARDEVGFYMRPPSDDGEGWDLLTLRPGSGPHGENAERKKRGPPDAYCPPAFDCNGVAPPLYHHNQYLGMKK